MINRKLMKEKEVRIMFRESNNLSEHRSKLRNPRESESKRAPLKLELSEIQEERKV